MALLHLRIPDEDHRQLKAAAALQGVSLSKFICDKLKISSEKPSAPALTEAQRIERWIRERGGVADFREVQQAFHLSTVKLQLYIANEGWWSVGGWHQKNRRKVSLTAPKGME